MKKLFGMTAIAAAMLLPLASTAAPSVYFVPADQGLNPGDPGSVEVWVLDTDVGSFDLNIHASDNNLTWLDAIYSPAMPLGDTAGPDPILPDADFSFTKSGQDIRVIGFSWLGAFGEPVPAAQTNPFLLFTLNFTAGASTGGTILSFTSVGDPQLGTNITDWDGAFVSRTSFGTACVRVGNVAECGDNNQVPEPASYGLAGLALLAAGAARRRRREAQPA